MNRYNGAYFEQIREKNAVKKVITSLRLKTQLLKVNLTTGIGFLRHEWSKLGQQNENNVLEIIFPVVDASFNSLKHFLR